MSSHNLDPMTSERPCQSSMLLCWPQVLNLWPFRFCTILYSVQVPVPTTATKFKDYHRLWHISYCEAWWQMATFDLKI